MGSVRYNPIHGAMLTDDKYIPQLVKLTTAIHEGGSKVFCADDAQGTSAPRHAIRAKQAVGRPPCQKFTHFEMPRALTKDESTSLWTGRRNALKKEAGFDGIETPNPVISMASSGRR